MAKIEIFKLQSILLFNHGDGCNTSKKQLRAFHNHCENYLE